MRAVILVFLMTTVTTIWGHCNNSHPHSKPSIQTICDVVERRGVCLFYDHFKQFFTGNIKRLNRKCCSDSDSLEKAYIVTKNGDKIVKTFNGFFKSMEFDTCAIKGETFCPKCCKVAVCDPNPCENGGTCSPINNSYSCNCSAGYLGKLCEVAVCDPNPCENGGTCSPINNSYSCNCSAGYLGKLCDVAVCDPNPCENGGTCSPIDNSYRCNCPTRYLGKLCEVNPCDVYKPFLSNGTCYPPEGGVSCSCLPGCPGINSEKIDCNFDESYCTWKQSSDDIFDWTRNKGQTLTTGTGPQNDHTGGGSYIYIEASSPRRLLDTAKIESIECIPSTSTQCLSFWYHMYGPSTGSLNVYIKTNQTGLGNAVWIKGGSQGNVWKQGYVNLSQIPFPYSIVFEGVRGLSYTSDIAIDDVTVVEGDCPGV